MIALIPTAIQAAIAAISGAAATFGPMITKHAPILLDIACRNLPLVLNAMDAVSSLLGLNKDNATDLGAKAAKSDLKPEDFDSIDAYINHLNHNVELTPEERESEGLQQLINSAVGVTLKIKAAAEKLHIGDISIPLLVGMASSRLSPQEMLEVIKVYDAKPQHSDTFADYLSGKLSLAESAKHSSLLMTALAAANPDLTEIEIEDKVMGLK
ncbi:hypothetical protein [Ferrimonas senticii]|uniref:hypothetical protein n=1 Tax=Ferrimonas senticii TaxID=394566 RepID=UPI0012EC4B58|nr:hypothetical protein [Ferrimonas senticii]